MLRLRPYQEADGSAILSWPMDERSFYRWTAGKLGEYPLSKEGFEWTKVLMRFTLLQLMVMPILFVLLVKIR